MKTARTRFHPLSVVLGSGAFTVVAYLVWLAWDQERTQIPGTSDWEGPYQPWQVVGLAVSLAGLVSLLTWRHTGWGAISAGTVVTALTFVWSVDAAGQETIGANLWPVGAMFIFVGSAAGLSLVVMLTKVMRHITQGGRRDTSSQDEETAHVHAADRSCRPDRTRRFQKGERVVWQLSDQAACMERVEFPKNSRSITVVGGRRSSSPAPSVSSSGTKWSAVGWAIAAPGPLVR